MKSFYVRLAIGATALGVCSANLAHTASVDLAKIPAPAAREIDFTKDVQPIFQASCLNCHNPEKAKSKFILDTRDNAIKGGENGPDILVGDSAHSPLIHFTARLVEDSEMPPSGKGEPLTAEQIGILRAWIDQGAKWPAEIVLAAPGGKPGSTITSAANPADKTNHWAFKAPVRPRVPQTTNQKWVRNPIDAFVLARLEKENLQPSPEAERRTLLRRMHLDLTGLPPSIDELEKFEADQSADAYEKALEAQLASPHYGERWGRHWLDVARYADSNGYEKDKPRSIWPYRDWVIKALNKDMPFDQFTVEQLAGDLLPKPTLDQKVATGFLRNSMLNQEGGIEPEQFRVEAMIDRMETLGKSFMGLTINCCQCHNHKYDPLSQKEYFQLYAFLNNDDESFTEVPAGADKKKRAAIRQKVRELEAKALKDDTNLLQRMDTWLKNAGTFTTNWVVLEPRDWGNFATKFEKQEDNSLLGGGDLQPGGVMRISVDTLLTNIAALRLDALTNANLMYGGPGILGRGSFIVKEFVAEAYALTNATVTNKIKFRRAVADLEAPGFAVTNAIDGDTDKGGWVASVTPDRRNQCHWAAFECAEPFGFPGGTRIDITIHQKFDSETHLDCHMLGCMKVSATTDKGPINCDMLAAAERSIARIPSDQRTQEQNLKLLDHFRFADAGCSNLNNQIVETFADWPYPPTTLVLHARTPTRTTHLFKRGDRLRPAEEVAAEVPAVLHSFPKDQPRNRLGLANWLVDRRNPTMARVIVNRIWQAYFGQGLVTTPEDFGTRVENPSHPEMLDWLACEFMDSGWSLKHMHRLIVTSATYRQSSKVSPEAYEKDQYNRLLARAPRFRVEAEVVQDAALSVAGLLNLKIGGPSVYPPIPGNVGDTAYGGFSWPETKGDARFRRGMYTFAKRSLPFPSLIAFDSPSGEVSCPRRVRSNTPLQALTTLNEKTFVEAAQAMGERVYKQGGKDDNARAAYAFELCTGRTPTAGELAKLLSFWQEQYQYFEEHTASAIKVAIADPKETLPDINLNKVAAWAMVSRAILNLDETVTRE